MLGIIGKNVKTEEFESGVYQSNDFSLLSANNIFEDDKYIISYTGAITRIIDSRFSKKDGIKSLITSLYEEYANNFYKYIDGTFFILLWDKSYKKLILANNRHQASNLYYSFYDGTLYFSSSLSKLSSKIAPAIPYMPSIRSFISNGFTYSDKTQIQNISKLLPTFALVFQSQKLDIINHWNEEVNFNERDVESLDERLDEYEHLYQEVTREYLNESPGKKIGCLLSGGHDTSFAAIQLRNITKEPIKGFTITFPDWSFNEEDHAKSIADKFNIDFRPIPFKPKHIDSIVELIYAVEEPVVGVALPLFVLSKEAKKEVDIIIGGDGGDTLWGEYYPVAEIHRYLKLLPRPIRILIHKLSYIGARATDWERLWELEHVLKIFAQKNYYDQFMRKLCTYRHFDDESIKSLLKSKFYEDGKISRSIYEVPFNRVNFTKSLIEGKLFNAFYTYMGFSQTKLMKYWGINFFMPTVQGPIINFITSLPMKWINGGNSFQRLTNSKKINRKFHKKALSRYLKSDEIYNRSFDIPWHLVLRPREDILKALEKALIKRDWYETEYLVNLFHEFKTQKNKSNEMLELKSHGYRIFTLLSLEIWCQLFIDHKKIESFNGSIVEFLGYRSE